jgi:cell division protein FtsI (penicillin-binding protein 3)
MLSKTHKIRSGLVLATFIISFSGIVARMFSIQVLQHDEFVARGKRIYETRELIYPKRGSILDRNYKPLALSEPTSIICADLRKVQDAKLTRDPSRLAEKLASILDLDKDRLLATFALNGREAVYLKRKPTQQMIDSVRELCSDRSFFETGKEAASPPGEEDDFFYSGIFFDNRVKRVYPDGTLLCHTLGFVADEVKPGKGLVRDDTYPVAGLEKSANKWLQGRVGWRMKNIDNRRRWVISARSIEEPAVDGMNVVLTIDEAIQFLCEEEIKQQFEQVSCKTITAIVLRPQTGEILALANYPDFDPNQILEFDPNRMSNQAIEYSYEPGSTFKAITGSIALDEGIITPSDMVFCENGRWKAPKGPLLHDAHGYGELTFEGVIVKSSNIGIAKVCQELGPTRLYEKLKKFGIGSKTQIPLPGEIYGTLRPPQSWSGYSMAEIPMGQEVAVTPLQLAMAFTIVANEGVLMKPLLIKEIQEIGGNALTRFEPEVVRRAISRESANTMKLTLQKVVATGGTGTRADIKGYSQGGKTGTAQRALPVKNEAGKIVKWVYSDTVFNSTFCGFAPVENPQVVILVALQGTVRPRHYGGTVAGPVFARIGEKVLEYLQVQPDEEVPDRKRSARLN